MNFCSQNGQRVKVTGGSKHGIPLALRVRRWESVARWRVRCSDRSKPLEQGWQGNGFEVDLGARMRERTGKGEQGRWGWWWGGSVVSVGGMGGGSGGGAPGEVRIERVLLGPEDKGVGGG